MKVKFLASLCGGEKDYHAGDTATFKDSEAVRLIDAGFALSVPAKAYDEAVAKLAKAKAQQDEKERQIEAIIYKEQLESEKEKLLNRVDEIDKILAPKKEDEE